MERNMIKDVIHAIVSGKGPGCEPDPAAPRPILPEPIEDYEYQAYCGAQGWSDDIEKQRPEDRPLFCPLGTTDHHYPNGGDLVVDRTGLEIHLSGDDFTCDTYFLHISLKSQTVAAAFVRALFGPGVFDATPENLAKLGFEKAED